MFIPDGYEEVQFCWAINEIPRLGLPPARIVRKNKLVVSREYQNDDGSKSSFEWLGAAVLQFGIEADGVKPVYRFDTTCCPHRVDAPPLTTSSHIGYSLSANAEHLDWLQQAQSSLGAEKIDEAIEFQQVDQQSCRSISLDKCPGSDSRAKID